MSEWFYARGGQQSGPVPFQQIVEMARSGALSRSDLVWTSTMKDWLPAGQMAEIFPAASTPALPVQNPSNPYAAPSSPWNDAAQFSAGIPLEEIIPGSEPLDVGACMQRGFNLTTRHFGMILLVGIIYMAISMAISFAVTLIGHPAHPIPGPTPINPPIHRFGEVRFPATPAERTQMVVSSAISLINQAVSLFLSLGITRIGLNIVSGKPFEIGMLFGGGKFFLRVVGASILFALMVCLGLLLLIVPGVYLALRYGQFLNAIVDRNLGIMDSFSYSSAITTNNRGKLFLLYLLCFLVTIAGLLACGVGLVFAIPVTWLAGVVAYRWMQYGHRAALDHPGTQMPVLSGLP